MIRFFIGVLMAGLLLTAPVAGNARRSFSAPVTGPTQPFAGWCESDACICEKLNDYGYDFWSARLDEADTALDTALEYSQHDLSAIRKMIQKNPDEMKVTACGWGMDQVVEEKLRVDHTIQLSDELQAAYEELLLWNAAKPSAFWFLVDSLRRTKSCHDFKIKAIAMRARDIYSRRFYSLECPF